MGDITYPGHGLQWVDCEAFFSMTFLSVWLSNNMFLRTLSKDDEPCRSSVKQQLLKMNVMMRQFGILDIIMIDLVKSLLNTTLLSRNQESLEGTKKQKP